MGLHKIYLGLGSNLGDAEANVREAIRLIGLKVGTVERVSKLITSEPWGFQSEHMFVNAALLCTSPLGPRQVLETTKAIEREMGRTEKSHGGHYADRIIDIDILLFDDITIDEPDLKIPHPLISQRPFVSGPLSEVIPKE